uniref:Uncharacterized protein n=1 Tax=Tanacetum cinerariifolium TaxID=118510 RepID=A0A6L2LPZ5_TANCI|nr:hypothetical protein [Tanacetum cinerariifolium]
MGLFLDNSEVFELVRRCDYFELVRRLWLGLDQIFQHSFKVFFDLHLTLLMAKKDMHTYVSRLNYTELETLITTYDIPLDLRPHLPDPNIRMINLPDGDTTIGSSSRSEQGQVREEPHGLDASILGRVADRTTSPAPAGTAIPHASLEEIAINLPDHKVVVKADHAAKRKASTGPEISTNAAKKTRSSKNVSRAGFRGLVAGDEVEQTDDGTLDDDDQHDSLEFAMEDIGNLSDVSQGEHINVIPLKTFDPSLRLDVNYPLILLLDKEVEAHVELSRGMRRAIRASFHVSHGVSENASSPAQEGVPALDTQPLDADAGADEIASDGNVNPYCEARVSNIARDVLERDLFSFVLGPYYIPYTYDEGPGSDSPPYTRDDWEEIHGVSLGLRKKELYKDPKVCSPALDRFPTPAETHRLRELSLVELSDRMSVLKCQLITYGSMLNDRYDHSLRDVERLSKQCTQQTQTIKKQSVELRQQNKFVIRANDESNFAPLVQKFLKSGEFNRAFTGVLNTTISVGVECGLRMDQIDEEFRGLSQKVVGFILNAKEKFDRVIATFPDTTFPFLEKVSQHFQSSLQDIARLELDIVTSSHQTSSATASLRANTHIQYSTSSSGTFGHTSTLEHLKKRRCLLKKEVLQLPRPALDCNYFILFM